MDMQRFAIRLSYDGTPFSGWARQPNQPSVQQAVEDALFTITRTEVRTVVAGRTDAGVHALGQMIHCDLSPEAIAKLTVRDGSARIEETLVRRLNAVLARATERAVIIDSARAVPPGFDARFSALRRHYRYLIADGPHRWNPLRRNDVLFHPRELDPAAMHEAAQDLLGLNDFLSFCKPREHSSTIRDLQEISVTRSPDGFVEARLSADAFCHHMVRTIVGALISVGEGARPVDWPAQRLGERVRDANTKMAAGHALVLIGVDYPDDDAAAARADATRARRDQE